MSALMGWSVEQRGRRWFAVKVTEARVNGSVGPVRLRRELSRLPDGATRVEAEREVARLVTRNVLR